MVIELYINNQLVDIDENTEISLTKEFQSDEDLERREAEYSYEIELPITFTNQKVFGFANSMDVKHKFYQQYSAQLYAEHIMVIDGKFMLTEINDESFVGNIYVPSYKELKEVLGDKKMNEMDAHLVSLQTYDSINMLNKAVLAGGEIETNTYIPVSGEILTSNFKNDYVCFPYIVYNFPRSVFTERKWDKEHERFYNEETEPNNFVQLTEYKNTTFGLPNIYPSFNVLKVIEKLFNNYGFKVSGNIFNDQRFTDLWMTSTFDEKKYKDNINIPQFVSVYGQYTTSNFLTLKRSTTYSYHEKSQNGDRESYKYWSDDLFHSDGTDVFFASNPHEMYHEAEDGNGGSIVINKSGWYLVNFNTQTQFLYSGNASSSFSTSQVEIRLVKGDARTDVEWYSQFGQSPICPRYNDTVNEGEGYKSVGNDSYSVRGWKDADIKGFVRIPQNGGVATVHSYSNFSTDRFICGARFGQAAQQNRRGYYEYNYDGDEWNMMMLPWPEHINDLVWDEEKNTWILPLTNGKYQGEQPTIHTYDTAVVLMSENVYSYNGGYTEPILGAEYEKNGHKYRTVNWQVGKGFTNPANIAESKASFSGDYFPSGDCDESCVVWLNEGDTINAELLVSKNYMEEKYMPQVMTTWRIQMGLLSTDKNWKPEGNNIIPSNVVSLYTSDPTNFNQFLPDMSCNDFIEGFLKTFNLRISKIGSNEYSINYADLRKTTLNIVPLDKYLDKEKITERAIDLPSEYNFKFNVSTDEEGYKNGDNSPFRIGEEKKDNEKPLYDGHKTIYNYNNNTGDSVDVESKFSYNWYKTIWSVEKDVYKKWVEDGKPNPESVVTNYGGYIDKFPVIADAENWNKSFAEGSTQGNKTSAAPRLFYIDKTRIQYIYDNNGDVKIMMLKPKNNIDAFDLDFNSIPSFVGIEDSLFSTIIEPSYEIKIEMSMSNEDYQRINKNSLVKINDELFRVVKIDGHNVFGESDGDLVLKAII